MYMYYIPNENNVVFWISPKCGCTFLRKFYIYLNKFGQVIKTLNKNISYKHILFIRNPYKRLVSGYLDCYVGMKLEIKTN